jgi:hypothetical protein
MAGNGSDLRVRLTMLEQRFTTQAQSLEQLTRIVRDVALELSGALGMLNDAINQDDEGVLLDMRPLAEIRKRLEALERALAELEEA